MVCFRPVRGAIFGPAEHISSIIRSQHSLAALTLLWLVLWQNAMLTAASAFEARPGVIGLPQPRISWRQASAGSFPTAAD